MEARYLCALAAAAALAACSDEDLECSFEACGGDPVGTWNIDGACTPATGGIDEDCPGATLVRSVSYAGTWTFEADLTYEVDGQALETLQGSFPRSCLGQIARCEDVSEQGITCRTAGERCECNSVSSEPFVLAGTWTSAGSTLTLDGVSWLYCRSAGS
jgi:hypothetical protein